MRRRSSRTRSSARSRAFLTIASANAAGNAINFAAMPVLARLFTPEAFGAFAVVSALSMALCSFAGGRLELAVPLAKSDEDAKSLVLLGTYFALATSILFLAGAATAMEFSSIGDRPAAEWIWTVPLLALPLSTFQLLNAWAIRHLQFSRMGRRTILQAAVSTVLQLIAGVVGLAAGGLILGYTLGQAVGTLSLLFGSGLLTRRSRIAKASLLDVLRRYRRFPIYLAPAGLLNTLGLQVPVLLIAYCYGQQAAGHLGLTQRVLAVPVVLLAQAIAQIYLGELTRARREEAGSGAELELFESVSIRLAAIAVPLLIGLWFSPWVFDLVFGEQWRISGQMARALGLMAAVQLVGFPISQTLVVYERVLLQLTWDVCRFAGVALGILIPWKMGVDVVTTVSIYGSVSALAYALGWAMARQTILRDAKLQPRPPTW